MSQAGSSGSWLASFAIFAGAVVAVAVVVTNLSGPADPVVAEQAARETRTRAIAGRQTDRTSTVRSVATAEDAGGSSADNKSTPAAAKSATIEPKRSAKSEANAAWSAFTPLTLDRIPVLETAYGEPAPAAVNGKPARPSPTKDVSRTEFTPGRARHAGSDAGAAFGR